jgi:peptidoglycan/LPS O-acetylase OafA/YrhL
MLKRIIEAIQFFIVATAQIQLGEGRGPDSLTPLAITCALALAAISCKASYVLIEEPARKCGLRLSRNLLKS